MKVEAIMGRDICEDITLSDGTFLPAGTFVTANSYQITHDSDILQSDSDPNIFDGTMCPSTKSLCFRHRYLVCNPTFLNLPAHTPTYRHALLQYT
jgi:hypothetical protein